MKKRVALISTSYPDRVEGWQGIFISRVLHALCQRPGLEMSVWAPDGARPANCQYLCSDEDVIWLSGLLQSGGISHVLRERPIAAMPHVIRLLRTLRSVYRRSKPQIFHVNWLQNSIPLYGTDIPAVIPVLGNDMSMLNIPGMTTLLRAVFRQRSCVLAPNAYWMESELKEKFGKVARIQAMPFGIDPHWYRLKRSPSSNPRVWLVVCRLTANKIGPLFEWSESLAKSDEVHLFGPNVSGLLIPEHIHYHGAVSPEQLFKEWFPNATGLISLSRHGEGLPQIMLEALASGLPIIATDQAAHREIVREGVSGTVVSDQSEFLAAIRALSQQSRNFEIAEVAREFVSRKYGTWADCASRYDCVYSQLVS